MEGLHERHPRDLARPWFHAVILTVCGAAPPVAALTAAGPSTPGPATTPSAPTRSPPRRQSQRRPVPSRPTTTPVTLEVRELTILTGWAEGLAEALAYAPAVACDLLADAHAGASWRTAFGIAAPPLQLSRSIELMGLAVAAATATGGPPSFDTLLESLREDHPDELALDGLVRRVLRSTLEQLRARQATADNDGSHRP
jgi:hypothetical protein